MSRQPGEYFELERRIQHGDTLEVRLPMALRLEPLPERARLHGGAVMYGPIVLAARLGTQGLTPGSQLIINERESGNMLNEAIEIPAWTKPLAELLASLQRTSEESVTFTTAGFDGGAASNSFPGSALTHERYNLYWRRSG